VGLHLYSNTIPRFGARFSSFSVTMKNKIFNITIVAIACITFLPARNAAFVDPDTVPRTIMRKTDGKLLALVMSDEFQLSGRGFGPGEDQIFEALQKPDDSNESIEFCKP
jgi:hypothetical protein